MYYIQYIHVYCLHKIIYIPFDSVQLVLIQVDHFRCYQNTNPTQLVKNGWLGLHGIIFLDFVIHVNSQKRDQT